MTRTERASYPRAVIRDRSMSRTGLDNHIRKGGAGRHNWGGIQDEPKLELEALSDEERELAEENEGSIPNGDARGQVNKNKDNKKPILSKSTSSLSAEELQAAKTIRKNALKKKDIDLATIARTSSAVSSSPP
ncbi:hypothetical protein M378DRAFT_63872, partial [Amanita muscaria Koide BX008]